jgi:hypothetical protein
MTLWQALPGANPGNESPERSSSELLVFVRQEE